MSARTGIGARLLAARVARATGRSPGAGPAVAPRRLCARPGRAGGFSYPYTSATASAISISARWIEAGCINRSTRGKGQHIQAGDTLEMGISRDHDEVPLQSRRGDERVNVPYMSS